MELIYFLIPIFTILGIVLLAFFITGLVVFRQTVMDHRKTEKHTINDFFQNEEMEEEFNGYSQIDSQIKTTHNRRIVMKYIKANNPNGRTVVLIHGIYGNMFMHVPYAIEYLKRGYNVVIYNQRSIGGSVGRCKTYGYYERFDLSGVVKYIREEYHDEDIIVHGFSMGAATAAMHSELNEKSKTVKLYILDSPFSSMYDELLYIAKRGRLKRPKNRKLPFKFMLRLGNLINKIFLRFWYQDVVPREAVAKCSVPMFIIHGKKDPTCPCYMGEEIYDNKIHGVREIWTPQDSVHINSYFDNPVKYYEKVINFININI